MAKMKDQQLVEVIGRNIARIRKERGLSQTELGKLMGISQLQVLRYEKGYNILDLIGVQRAMKALRIKDMREFYRNEN